MTDARFPEIDVGHASRVPDFHSREDVHLILVARHSGWKAVLASVVSGTRVPGHITVASPHRLDGTGLPEEKTKPAKNTRINFHVVEGARNISQIVNEVVKSDLGLASKSNAVSLDESNNNESNDCDTYDTPSCDRHQNRENSHVAGGNEENVRELCADKELPSHPHDSPGAGFDGEGARNDQQSQWVWILHEDSTVQTDTLERLLYQAERSEKLGAVGPKQISATGELLEVGIRATRSARRVPEMEPGEVDQGQHDTRSDILGVGSAGMLVRRQAGNCVAWFDPALGPYGEGLEFSRRLWSAGWRVAVVPEAAVVHQQASLGQSDFARRRAAQIYNALLAAPATLLPALYLLYLLGGPMRSLARLALKDTLLATQELIAVVHLFGMTGALLRARKLNHRVKNVPASVLRALEETPRDVRKARRNARKMRKEAIQLEGRPDPITLAEFKAWRRLTRRACGLTVGITCALAIAVFIGHFGSPLAGGALLPDSWQTGDLFEASLRMWLPDGDGYAAPVDALWVMLAPFTVLSGSLGALTSFLVIAGIPLSAGAAFYGAGALTNSAHVRAFAGVAWALAPPLTAAIAQGHVAGIVWHILAPLFLRTLVQAWRGSGSALGCAALLGAYMACAAPATLLVLFAISLAGLLVCAQRRKRWIWLTVPAFLALFPTLRALADTAESWRFLAATPGQSIITPSPGLGLLSFNPLVSITSLAQLRDEIFGLGASVVLLAVAFVAFLCRRRNHPIISCGLALLALGWMWAALASSVITGTTVVNAAVEPVHGWSGIGLSAACLGLLMALVGAGDGLRTDLARRSFGLSQIFSFCATTACLAAPVMMAVSLISQAHSDSWLLKEAQSDRIPAVARSVAGGNERGRTLVLSAVNDGVQAELLRENGDKLHETSLVKELHESQNLTSGKKNKEKKGTTVAYDAADADLAAAIASLAGDSSAFSDALARHAVAVVLVDGQDTSARRTLISRLKAHPKLTYITSSELGDSWWVNDFSGRASIISSTKNTDVQNTESPADVASNKASPQAAPKSSSIRNASEKNANIGLPSQKIRVETQVDASSDTRVLTLAERANPGWKATLNGEKLEEIQGSWYQQWKLPATPGTLVIDFDRTKGLVIWSIQMIVAMCAIVAALPNPRRKGGPRRRYERVTGPINSHLGSRKKEVRRGKNDE